MSREEWKHIIESTYPKKDDRREVAKHLRLALTGNFVGPDLYTICSILGKDIVYKRLINYIKEYEKYMANITRSVKSTNCHTSSSTRTDAKKW